MSTSYLLRVARSKIAIALFLVDMDMLDAAITQYNEIKKRWVQ